MPNIAYLTSTWSDQTKKEGDKEKNAHLRHSFLLFFFFLDSSPDNNILEASRTTSAVSS
jgi:hypothetical protein